MKLLLSVPIFLLILQAMDAEAQRKITGPWLWMIAPTQRNQGGASSTDVDSLAVASGGRVTEADIAENGANAGDAVGALVWTLGAISERGWDNINDVVNRIGLGRGDINDHSAYALITLESRRAQRVQMWVGSDDSIKVWLNGDVVHKNAVNRGAADFQDRFPVDIKQGDNLLLVKVSERGGDWSMFVGVDADITAVFKPTTQTLVSISPSSIASPRVGQQLTVTIKITDGREVAGYQLTLRFDNTALRYVRGANANYLVNPFVAPIDAGPNEVTLGATSLGVLSKGDGTLATVTFQVLAAKASTLTLRNVILSNEHGDPLPVNIESGRVNVPSTEVPGRVTIAVTPNDYITADNIVEPKGGNFSGVIPLTFTVLSKANTRMRNQTVRLTTETGHPGKEVNIAVSLSAATIRTANSTAARAQATLTLEEISTGTKTINVTARVGDITETLRLVVRQTAAALTVTPFEKNVTTGDRILIQAQVKSKNGTPMPNVPVRFRESSNRIAFTPTNILSTDSNGTTSSTLRAIAAGAAQFRVEAEGLPEETFNITVVRETTPVTDVPGRIEIVPAPGSYISNNNNVVEPKGGNFSGEIPLTFTVWSETNTRMRNQTLRLTTNGTIDVALSATTIRTTNSGNATANATLTLEEASAGTQTVSVTASIADTTETLRFTVKQTAASLSITPFARNVTAGDEIPIEALVRSRNATLMPNVNVRFIESSNLMFFDVPTVRTGTDGKAIGVLRTTATGAAQFRVEAEGLPRQTFNVTVSEAAPSARDVPGRIEITFTPTPYISRNNVVEPKGGDFSGEIPLTFTVWSEANTRMLNQTVRLTTDSSLAVSVSPTTIRTANTENAAAQATLTLEEASTGTQSVTVTARVADITETLIFTVRQTAASLTVAPIQTDVTAGDEVRIQTQVKSRNGTVMPNVTVGFGESSGLISFSSTSVRTNTEGRAETFLRTSDAGTAQFIVSALNVQPRTFSITIVPKITTAEIPDRIEIVSTPGPHISRDNVVEPKGGDFSGEIPLTFTVWSKADTRMQNQTLQLIVESQAYISLSAETIQTTNAETPTAQATVTLEQTSIGIQTVVVTAKIADVIGTLELTVKQTPATLTMEGVEASLLSGEARHIAAFVKSKNNTVMRGVPVRFKESSGLIAFATPDAQTGTDGRAYSLLTSGGQGPAQFSIEVPGISEAFFDINITTQTDIKRQQYEFSSRQGTKTWYGWRLEHYTVKQKFFFPGEIVELLDVKATVTAKGHGRLELIEESTHSTNNWIEVAIRAKEHRDTPTKLRVAVEAQFKREGSLPGAPSVQEDTVSERTTLFPNYPNPFNPETWIPYSLAEPAEVTLHIYAADGRLIRTLALGYQLAGIYRNKSRAAYWDGRNTFGEPVASGIYFYTLRAGKFSKTHKMLVVK